MKALVFEKYGSPEKMLKAVEVEKPTPGKNEVLIKICATSINDYDWSMITGRPLLYRLMYGIFQPKHKIAGMEFSGIVEGKGEEVQEFKIGEEVFGDISGYGFGTFSEYICVTAKAIIKKPPHLSFEQATAIPHASLLAWQALVGMGNLSSGQKVLINGAGGGVGLFGLQMAKMLQCEVTGVDSAEKLEMMKSAGFDHTIDYEKINFTKNGICYDLILDCKSSQSTFSCLRSLKRKGKYISIGGKLTTLLNLLMVGKIVNLFSSKKIKILALKPNAGIEKILSLIEQNQLKIYMDGPYSMQEIPQLISYFGEGRHKGKIVVKMQDLN